MTRPTAAERDAAVQAAERAWKAYLAASGRQRPAALEAYELARGAAKATTDAFFRRP